MIRSGHMTMIDEPLEMNRILVEWFQKCEATETWRPEEVSSDYFSGAINNRMMGVSLGGLVVMFALVTTVVMIVGRSFRADARARGYETI